MAHENVEIIQQIIDDWNNGDYAASLASFDPAIELIVDFPIDLKGAYRGHDGLSEFMGRFWAGFQGAQTEIIESSAADDQVVLGVRLSGQGKRSGVETDIPSALLQQANYSLSSDSKNATMTFTLCAPAGASSIVAGFYFTGGNPYCAPLTH